MEKFKFKKEKIVIKIGTATLSDSEKGINIEILKKLTDIISKLLKNENKIILVTSGAVALGAKELKLKKKPKSVLEKQYCAAIGQVKLMETYEKLFSKHKITIAQILLTRHGFSESEFYINTRETLLSLLEKNVIPIINENDAVSSEEIRFGDNDVLSALVSDLISANRLFILTDEKGLYESNPKTNKNAKLISCVEKITPEIETMAKGKGSEFSSGGMTSKIEAAKIATKSGITVHIIHGREPENILKLQSGESIGTTFLPEQSKTNNKTRKNWIAHALVSEGKIYVDQGAQKAIQENGKSLLPSGIRKISGNFNRGSAVEIVEISSNKSFAKGLTNYNNDDLLKISGMKSSEIEKLLGFSYGETIIHRDNLVLI